MVYYLEMLTIRCHIKLFIDYLNFHHTSPDSHVTILMFLDCPFLLYIHQVFIPVSVFISSQFLAPCSFRATD